VSGSAVPQFRHLGLQHVRYHRKHHHKHQQYTHQDLHQHQRYHQYLPAPQIPLDAAVGPATQLPTTGANADSMLRPVEIHPRPVAMPSAERNGNLTHEEGNASTGASSGNRTLSTQAWVLLVLVLILCVPVPLLFIRNKQTLQSGKPKQPDVEQTLKRESEPLFAPTHMPTSAMSHAVPVYSPLSPTLASVGLPA